jgi:hypothetical protein
MVYFTLAGTKCWVDWTHLMVYGIALDGAAVGGTCAMLIARSVSPVGGVFHDLHEEPVRRSRLAGALVGGVAGGVMGAILPARMYAGESTDSPVPIVVQGFLAVGTVGALLGLVSGIQKK